MSTIVAGFRINRTGTTRLNPGIVAYLSFGRFWHAVPGVESPPEHPSRLLEARMFFCCLAKGWRSPLQFVKIVEDGVHSNRILGILSEPGPAVGVLDGADLEPRWTV
jgi:hypothetical protein